MPFIIDMSYHANNQNTKTNNNKPYILIYGMHTGISILIYGMPTQKNARDSHMRHHPVDIEFKINIFFLHPSKLAQHYAIFLCSVDVEIEITTSK